MQQHPPQQMDCHQSGEKNIKHTCNVFLEVSQVGERHEGTSGKYFARKYVLNSWWKLKGWIDISGFLPFGLWAPEIC